MENTMADPEPTLQKLTRREQRRRQKSPIEVPPLPNDSETITVVSTHLRPIMSAPVRLLVCSIGNPASYMNTLHSAGHTVLTVVASSLAHPPFQKSRAHGNGLVSVRESLTLWQSSSLMNVSGVGVAAAYKQFVKDARGEPTKLIVVHDELELALGKVQVKKGSNSAKGHNGLKSIGEQLRGGEYTRIGVGIGRPESREPNVVAGYVLRKMSPMERGKIEGCAGKVVEELWKLRES